MTETAWIVFAFVIPLGLLWAALIIDLVRRDDIGLAKKVLWAVIAVATAEFGALVYIALRPLRYPEDGVEPGADNPLADRLLVAAEMGGETDLASAREAALSALR